MSNEAVEGTIIVRIATEGREIDSLVLQKESVVIGRDPQADIHLQDPAVSRQHAILDLAPPSVRVRDLVSANGTYLNDERITIGQVAEGDVLRIGPFDLRFVMPKAVKPRTTRPDLNVPGLQATLEVRPKGSQSRSEG